MKKAGVGIALIVGLAMVAGCSSKKVLMPPKIDLHEFQKIGLVEFTSNAEGDLQALASQKFIQTLQSAQPGVPVLELGDQKHVLKSIERSVLDYDAIQAIGEMYNVDAVVIGNLEVTDVKPHVNMTQMLTSMAVQADVEAALTTRLMETESGATMWTRSARWQQTVAHAGVDSRGGFQFDASDPEGAYGKLVDKLVYHVTRDFRSYWVKQ